MDARRFVCCCGGDLFRCHAEVAGHVDAEVRTAEGYRYGDRLDCVYLDRWALSLECYVGPFTCMECGREYDQIPPEGWNGWAPADLRPTPRRRVASGELPLLDPAGRPPQRP